jgi:hypothetical protein
VRLDRALTKETEPTADFPPDLARVIDLWPDLPEALRLALARWPEMSEAIRGAILALVSVAEKK